MRLIYNGKRPYRDSLILIYDNDPEESYSISEFYEGNVERKSVVPKKLIKDKMYLIEYVRNISLFWS